MEEFVIIWDPTGEVAEGTITGFKVAELVRQRGGCILPVAPELTRADGAGGYVIRKWGAGGQTLGNIQAKLCCPITVLIPEGPWQGLHWAARLRPAPEVADAAATGAAVSNGLLRLVADNSRSYTQKCALTPQGENVTGDTLGKTDAAGGWTVRGKGVLSVPMAGHCGFALYGVLPRVLVDWVAVSVVRST